jgi:hypothetical protein
VPAHFLRQSVADADGKFAFQNVGAGKYMILATVTWKVYGGGRYAVSQETGGILTEEIDVKPNMRYKTILSPQSLCPAFSG